MTLRHRVTFGPLLVACLLLSACGASPTSTVAAVVVDQGATTRDVVLSRYRQDATAESSTDGVDVRIPDIVGTSPDVAEARLAEAGLSIRIVPFDRTQPVTSQWPPYGQPVPLDRTVEAWLGDPPPDATAEPPAATDVAAPTPDASDPETPAEPTDPTEPPADPVVQESDAAEFAATAVAPAAAVAPSFVLPPHTEGRLRINPRQLPALPLGTQLTGNASWYGPGFHGRQTACGGIYDQNGATIASRELRCGTVIRITGPTGLTVEATVTDWGPAEWTDRRFDLSAAVFNAIAPLGTGVIPVRMVTTNTPS